MQPKTTEIFAFPRITQKPIPHLPKPCRTSKGQVISAWNPPKSTVPNPLCSSTRGAHLQGFKGTHVFCACPWYTPSHKEQAMGMVGKKDNVGGTGGWHCSGRFSWSCSSTCPGRNAIFRNPYISLHYSGYRETPENTSQANHKDQNSDGKGKSEPSIFYQFCDLVSWLRAQF